MSCQIKVNDQGKYEVTAPNGESSILFNKILSLPDINNEHEALESWMKVYTSEFKEWYGKDWENLSKEETDKLINSGFLDTNGEPVLFYRGDVSGLEEFNYSPNIGKFGQGVYIAENLNQARAFAEENNKEVYPVFLKPTKIKYFKDKLDFLKEVAKFNNIKTIPTEEHVKSYIDALHVDNTTVIGDGLMGREYNTYSKNNVKTLFKKAIAFEQGNLYDNQARKKLEFNEKFQEERKSEQFLEELANKLRTNLGLTEDSVQFITELDAEAITADSKNPYKGQSAFYYNGKVFFVRGKLSYENVLHEFAHPLIEAISIDNPGLFNKLYNDIIKQTEGQIFLNEAISEYPEVDPEDIQIKKEVLVKAMTYINTNENATLDKQPSSTLKAIIDKILYAIRQLLRKVNTKPIDTKKLSLNITLKELSDMLIDESWNTNMTILKTSDIVSYINSREIEADLNEVFTENKGIVEGFKALDKLSLATRDLLNKAIESNDTETIKYILSNVSGQFLLEEMSKDLSKVSETAINRRKQTRAEKIAEAKDAKEKQAILEQNAKEEINEIIYRNKVIANNLVNINNVSIKAKKYIDSLKDAPDQVTAFSELKFYDQVLATYAKELKSLDQDLRDAGLEANSQIRKDVQSILLTVDDAKSSSQKIKENYLSEILSDKFNQYNNPSVEKTKAEIEKLKNDREKAKSQSDKNYISNLIKAQEHKLKSQQIAPETMRKYLTGQMGDVGYLSIQLENFISSQDPSIATFAKYYKENTYAVAAQTYVAQNMLLTAINDLTSKIGISPDQLDKFSNLLLFKDKSVKRNRDTGELELYDIYSFLNENQNYKYTLSIINEAIKKAKDIRDEDPTEENIKKYIDLKSLKSEHTKLYFKNEYVDSYYYADEELLSTDLGRKAKEEAQDLYNKMLQYKTIDEENDVDALANYETAEALFKEYKKLFSLYDDYGTKKQGDELRKAELLIENRNAKRKFYEYVEIPNAFLSSLKGAEAKIKAQLEKEGLSPILNKTEFDTEFKNRRAIWLKNNTHSKIKDEFYTVRTNLFNEISKILNTIPNTNNFSVERQILLDTLQGRKDDDGQPIGTEMKEELLATIKKIQQEIQDAKEKTVKDTNNKLDPALASRLNKLFDILNNLQETQATSYYIEIVNNFYNRIKKAEDPDIIPKEVTLENVDKFLDPNFIKTLRGKDAEFDKWFEDNHILKTRIYKNQIDQAYERTKAWSVVKPKDKKYLEFTDIYDDNGILIDKIEGIPNNQFFERRVKNEFRTGYNSKTGELNNYSHFDIQKYQLPKSLEEMTVVKNKYAKKLDEHNEKLKEVLGTGIPWNHYINMQYHELKEQNNDQYKLLKLISDYHLNTQKGLDRKKTLGYELPRLRKDKYQYLTSGEAKQDIIDKAKTIKKGMAHIFSKKEDDFDYDLNYEEVQQSVGTESYINNDGLTIPIRGKYDIDTDQVSTDVLTSLFQYNYSAEENKKLHEMQPIAIAMKELAMNNPVKFIKQKTSTASNLLNSTEKLIDSKENNRKHLIDGMVEVLFEGKGLTESSNKAALVKITNTALKISAHSFFALDISSALKNYFGAQFQIALEAVGGKYYSYSSWTLGRPWATKAMYDISKQIYSEGPKNLNVQLIDVFDAIQGRHREKFGTSPSRSIQRDIVNAGWLTSTRKWLEGQATLQIFSAIMHDTKVMQNGKEIRYIDAFEIDPTTKTIKLKDGIDKKWDIGNIGFVQTKSKVHEVSGFLQGLYASEEQGLINRNLIFRNIGALKKYFTKMFMHRFAAKGLSVGDMRSWVNPEERLNLATGQSHMGFYMQNILTLNKIIKSGGKHFMYLNKEEKRGFYLGVVELMKIQLLIYIQMMIMASFGTDPDDEKRWSKIAKQTGALPSFLTNEKYSKNFDAWNWTKAHILLLAMNVEAESKHFIPAPGYGLKDMYNVFAAKDSIAMTASYEALLDILYDLFNTAFDDAPLYKKDTGALTVQEKGTNKFWKKALKTAGISGKLIDPITTAKNTENARRSK